MFNSADSPHTPPSPTYDLIVFDATSFVGQIITNYLFKQYGVDDTLKWAIAGRSEAKLVALHQTLGPSAATLPIIVAEAQAAEALHKLRLYS